MFATLLEFCSAGEAILTLAELGAKDSAETLFKLVWSSSEYRYDAARALAAAKGKRFSGEPPVWVTRCLRNNIGRRAELYTLIICWFLSYLIVILVSFAGFAAKQRSLFVWSNSIALILFLSSPSIAKLVAMALDSSLRRSSLRTWAIGVIELAGWYGVSRPTDHLAGQAIASGEVLFEITVSIKAPIENVFEIMSDVQKSFSATGNPVRGGLRRGMAAGHVCWTHGRWMLKTRYTLVEAICPKHIEKEIMGQVQATIQDDLVCTEFGTDVSRQVRVKRFPSHVDRTAYRNEQLRFLQRIKEFLEVPASAPLASG